MLVINQEEFPGQRCKKLSTHSSKERDREAMVPLGSTRSKRTHVHHTYLDCATWAEHGLSVSSSRWKVGLRDAGRSPMALAFFVSRDIAQG